MNPNPPNALRAQLNLFAFMGKRASPQSVVLSRGLEFPTTQLTKEELDFVNRTASAVKMSFGGFKPKECFSNSQLFLYMAYKNIPTSFDVSYIEGYFAVSDLPIPIHHGWISLNGKLVDLTLTQDEYDSQINTLENRVVGIIPSGFEYLGIPIDTEDVIEKIEVHHEAHNFLDDWRHEFRSIRNKYIK